MKAAIVHSFDRPLVIVQVSGARSSDLVAVFGVGGLGHLAIQYARIAGAEVVAVGLIDENLGAPHTVNAMESDPVEEIKKLGGTDAAICVAVSPKAFEQAYKSLRRGGTLVLVALPADNHVQLPIFVRLSMRFESTLLPLNQEKRNK